MPRRAFVPTLLLALTFVAAKLVLAWPLLRRTPTDLSRLIAASAEDVAAAMVFGLLAALALHVTVRRPKLHRATWHLTVGFALLCAVFAVANIAIFHALGCALNAGMFSLVGRFGDMRSSLAAHVSAGLIVGMAVVLVAFVAVALRPTSFAPSRRPAIVLLIVAVGWVAWGSLIRAQADPDTWVRHAGVNPHRELLGSLVSRYVLDRRVEVTGPFPPDYLDDFKPAAERALPPLTQFAPPPRNVIVVVLESVSAQYMSVYGAPYDTTPILIAESHNALTFDRFYANVGYTFRSMVPLVYSVYPGLPWRYRADLERPIPPGLAGALKARGYRTAFLAAANPEWEGMDYMARDAGFADVIGPAQLGGPAASSWGTEDGALIDGLIRWIDADAKRDRPFFAMAWTDQTHDPYTLDGAHAAAPARQFVDPNVHRHGDMLNRYLAALRQADHHLGRLFAALRARGLADDTLVVITGDHGEAFGEPHDVVSHGNGLYDECQRVPMMFWNPRMFPGGRRDARVGAHVDINPTIAHLLNVTPASTWQGASLFSPDHPGRAYMLVDLSGYQFAVADANHKYILHATSGFERMFDLKADPLEQRDVARADPKRAADFRARISAFVHAEERYLNDNR